MRGRMDRSGDLLDRGAQQPDPPRWLVAAEAGPHGAEEGGGHVHHAHCEGLAPHPRRSEPFGRGDVLASPGDVSPP